VVSLSLASAGCGKSGPQRFAVSGRVTLDGAPIEDGEILLRPDQATKAPTAAAPIENGAYAIPEDRGPLAGTYDVVITAQRKTGKKVQAEMIGSETTDQYEQYVPSKYNDASTLSTIIDRSRDDLNFDLNSK
jgi:hypothetical protein